PRQVGIVELDRGEIVGFVVVGADGRLRAHDLPGVDADHVGRAEQPHADRCRVDAVHAERDTERGLRGQGRFQRIARRDARGETLSPPGQEDDAGVAHAGSLIFASSNSFTTMLRRLSWALLSASEKVTSGFAFGSRASPSVTAAKRSGSTFAKGCTATRR